MERRREGGGISVSVLKWEQIDLYSAGRHEDSSSWQPHHALHPTGSPSFPHSPQHTHPSNLQLFSLCLTFCPSLYYYLLSATVICLFLALKQACVSTQKGGGCSPPMPFSYFPTEPLNEHSVVSLIIRPVYLHQTIKGSTLGIQQDGSERMRLVWALSYV